MLESRGSIAQQALFVDLRTDGRVGTDERALVALDAGFRIPDRNFQRDAALLPTSGVGGEGAIQWHGAHGKFVAATGDDFGGDVLHEFRRLIAHGRANFYIAAGGLGNLHLVEARQGVVHRGEVLLHHLFATLTVGLLDALLDLRDGLVLGQHAADGEEASLHDGVDAPAHAGVARHLVGVDGVELDLLGDDVLLRLLRQSRPHALLAGLAVEQQDSAGLDHLGHVELLDKVRLMAGHEVGLFYQIGGVDGLLAEAQVRGGGGAGLFRVVNEVALGPVVRFLADDLDAVLVGAHGSVGAESVEHAADGAFFIEQPVFVVLEVVAGDIVDDTHHEVILGLGRQQLLEHTLDHGWREFFAG